MCNRRHKKNMYPLPERTVVYSNRKHMKPIPKVGNRYHCFDDGKITFSRHYIIKVTEVLGQMQFKRKYPEAFNQWLKESKSDYWIFSRSSDKFIITNIEETNNTEIFVRTKQGGWFSIGYPLPLTGGKLDVTGRIWDGLLENIDNFDFTNEEKRRLISENTITNEE